MFENSIRSIERRIARLEKERKSNSLNQRIIVLIDFNRDMENYDKSKVYLLTEIKDSDL